MIKAEDFEQAWQDVVGLHPDDIEQWVRDNIKEMPYLLAYLLGRAGYKVKEDVKNVRVLPACEYCGKVACFRAKTLEGKWANMCFPCYAVRGIGLGMSIGYKLKLVKL